MFFYKLFHLPLTISRYLAVTLDILCHWKNLKFLRIFWVITCGIRAQGSNTMPECSSTCLCGTINLNKYADVVFFE